jgi:hypothetical protein
MAVPVSVPLLDHFAALSDPRQHGKVLYPLPEILVLSATIAGGGRLCLDDAVGNGTGQLSICIRYRRGTSQPRLVWAFRSPRDCFIFVQRLRVPALTCRKMPHIVSSFLFAKLRRSAIPNNMAPS